jgi:hypothetical protein
MSTTTTNLGLVKPALTDVADITVINSNMDAIDTAIASKANTSQLPTKVSQLTNDEGFITATSIPSSLPANGGNAATVNSHTANSTPNTIEQVDLIKMTNEVLGDVNLKAPLANPTFTGIATLPTNSVSDSLLISLNAAVTAAGTTQATATALTKDENIVTSGTGGVQVQGATTGKIVVVINRTASAINVYPASGHYFDGLAVNIPISLPANAFIELYGFSSTQWNSTINAVTNAMNTIIADVGGYFATKNVEAALQQTASGLTSHEADNTRHENYILDTSTTANTCTGACTTYTAYTDGSNITLKVKNTNTGATTINVNGLGAKPIKDALGNAINAGTLVANNIYFLVYEVTYGGFILANCIQAPNATGNTSGTVSIASPVTSPIVPVIMASCSDTKITSTSATTILTCTPTVQGNFEVNLYLGITSSTTPVTITITWTDGRGAQTYTMFNAYPFTADAHSIAPYFINAVANQPITLTITAGTANQVYVSGAIRGI